MAADFSVEDSIEMTPLHKSHLLPRTSSLDFARDDTLSV